MLNVKMRAITRILVLIGALLLFTTKFWPIWSIGLTAPQYPEGLSLQIWDNHFSGDVTTVNILNHYVGMSKIEEASFPEFRHFPTVFMALAVFGILVALFGRKFLNQIWSMAVVAFALWALHDFYIWEYKFGHELNPDAAIKMEDMVYQPPLIGEKEFLNITATSWPGVAGWAFTFTGLIAVFSFVINLKRDPLPK